MPILILVSVKVVSRPDVGYMDPIGSFKPAKVRLQSAKRHLHG